MISPNQIKAARAWMDWTREQLAEECGVSPSTIRNLEKSKKTYNRSAEPVRVALENKGFQFYGTHGVSYQPTETKTYEGPNSRDDFYEDLIETIKRKGGEIAAIFTNYEQAASSLGATNPAKLERLERLASLATVKCLLSDTSKIIPYVPSFQFRTAQYNPIGPLAQLIYGDKTAVIVVNGKDFIFHVMRSVETVQANLKDFEPRWKSASPMAVQTFSSGK